MRLSGCFLRCSFTILVLLAGCKSIDAPPALTSSTPTALAEQEAYATASTATSTSEPTPTATVLPPLAILLAAPGSDAGLESALRLGLQPALVDAGWAWEVRAALSPEDLSPGLRLVIVIPPDPGLAELVALAPQTQFLAVGLPGFQPGTNLSLIGPTGFRPERAGFIAGMTAAAITLDWRVGVLGPSDLPEDRAAVNGFLNGAIFFCGLCLPYHGPNVDYPISLELTPEAEAAEIEAAVQQLQNLAVKTVYLPPGITSITVVEALTQAEINIIGSYGAPKELFRHWVAGVQPDPLQAAMEILPLLLAGEGGLSREMPYAYMEVNRALLSDGRRGYLEPLITDVLTGYIDPGVDLVTGDLR